MDLKTLVLTRDQRQLLVAYHPMDICLLQGGWASGKTLTSAYLTLHLAMTTPNITGLIVAPEIKYLRDDVAPLLLRLLQPHRYRYNQQTRVFTFPNGSRVYLRSLKNCQAISPDFIWVAHAEHSTEHHFKQLLRQLKPSSTPTRRVWLTCRPVPPDHWLTTYFHSNAVKPFRRVILHTLDNPVLQPSPQRSQADHNLLYHPKLTHIRVTHTPEEQQALFSGRHPDEVPEANPPALPDRIKQVLPNTTKPVMISNGVHLPMADWRWPRLGQRYAPTVTTTHPHHNEPAEPVTHDFHHVVLGDTKALLARSEGF
jgi:hypothetical protein